MRPSLGSQENQAVLRIVGIYIIVGSLWIYLSDTVLGWMIRDPAVIIRAAKFKGVFFILLTSALLYKLIRRYGEKLDASRRESLQNEERFRTIYDFANDAVFIHDAVTGEILDVNLTMCSMYGYTREAVRGLTVNDISLGEPPYSQAEALEWLRRAAAGVPQLFEWLCKKKDGTLFWTEVNMRYADIGVDGRIIVLVRDISTRKSVETELELFTRELAKANKELEAFNYSLSHDLRTYITRISTAGQILQDCHSDNRNADYCVTCINEACQAMDELTEAMLTLSRVSRGEIEQEIIDLSDMARGIVAGLRLSEPERRVDVTITSDLIATCDRQLLKIALENLLENAWKYTGSCPVGRIEFGEMIKQDGEKVFLVRDNGSGFDMSEADKLFKPFHRLNNAQGFPGTGVGLATVQRIIQRHGGEIDGEGEPGKGATFYFTLGGDRTI